MFYCKTNILYPRNPMFYRIDDTKVFFTAYYRWKFSFKALLITVSKWCHKSGLSTFKNFITWQDIANVSCMLSLSCIFCGWLLLRIVKSLPQINPFAVFRWNHQNIVDALDYIDMIDIIRFCLLIKISLEKLWNIEIDVSFWNFFFIRNVDDDRQFIFARSFWVLKHWWGLKMKQKEQHLFFLSILQNVGASV